MRLQRIKIVPSWSKMKNRKVETIKEDWTIKKNDSKFEARVSNFLERIVKEGKIKEFKEQVDYLLVEWQETIWFYTKKTKLPQKIWNRIWNYTLEYGKVKLVRVKYIADFVLTTNKWLELIVDAKWMEKPEFIIKKKLLMERYWKLLLVLKSQQFENGSFERLLLDN